MSVNMGTSHHFGLAGWPEMRQIPVMSRTHNSHYYSGIVVDIRPMGLGDRDAYGRMLNDRAVMAHLFDAFGREEWDDAAIDERLGQLMAQVNSGRRICLALVRPGENVFLGHVDLMHLGAVAGEAEAGLILTQELWGTGAAAEAMAFAIELGFEEFGLERIWFRTAQDNMKMRAVFERSGMLETGIVDGESVRYDVPKEIWPRVKARLSERLQRQAS